MAIANVRIADPLCQAMGDEQARVQALDNQLLDLRIGGACDEMPN
jgi:hypothetical protein